MILFMHGFLLVSAFAHNFYWPLLSLQFISIYAFVVISEKKHNFATLEIVVEKDVNALRKRGAEKSIEPINYRLFLFYRLLY